MKAEDEFESHNIKVAETERREGINPTFEKLNINFLRLCEGDPKAPVRFSVYSDNVGNRPDLFYGGFTSTVESLLISKGKAHQLLDTDGAIGGTLEFEEFK